MRDFRRARPLAVIGLAVTGVMLGAGLGALTNGINGRVSPLYFRNVLRWEDVSDVWRMSIAQGIFDGLVFGLVFTLIFATVVGLVSRARCPYTLGAFYLASIAVAALICWGLGGLTAMGLATLSPEFYRESFRGVPEETGAMLQYAWVGGSIWGLQFGGFASVIVGSVLFSAKWRQLVAPSPDAATGKNVHPAGCPGGERL